jgi:hypothetical protein
VRALSARSALRGVLARRSASGGRSVVLKPSRKARRALKNARRLVVTVQADVTTPNGTVRLRRTIALS